MNRTADAEHFLMSNVPLGSGGTSPIAKTFTAQVDYERMQHTLRIMTDHCNAAVRIATTQPLSELAMRLILAHMTEAANANHIARDIFNAICNSLDYKGPPRQPGAGVKQESLFPAAPPAGPYAEGR